MLKLAKPEFDPKKFVDRAEKAGFTIGLKLNGALYYEVPDVNEEPPSWFDEGLKNRDSVKLYLRDSGRIEDCTHPTPEEMASWVFEPVGRFRQNNFPTPNAEV